MECFVSGAPNEKPNAILVSRLRVSYASDKGSDIMNQCIFIGRITADPELRATESGTSIARFTLAVQGRGDTDFIPCTAFGRTAELLCEYVRKGHRISVEGRLKVSRVPKDDEVRTYYNINCDEITFLEGKERTEDESEQGC